MFSNKLDNKKINNNTNVDNTNDDFIENIKDLFNNKLDKKINNNNTNDDFIENIRDLLSILDYEPVLIKSGFDNNYLEYMSNGNNSLSFNEYLELIKPYLYDLINVYQAKGEWKLQLSAEIYFVLQKPDSNEIRIMYTRSIPEEIIIGCETEEVAEKLIMQILQKYQDNLQNKMKGSDFIFNGVNYLYYDLNRITISKGGSYIESPKWLKDKKCTINQKNTDNKCFQYATTLALNFNNIDKHHQRISKIKPFINDYNWNDINFPATKKDWNKSELNNKNVALNILYVPFNNKKTEIVYKSKYNLIRDNQIILLVISNGKNWHYLAVKSLSRLLRGISSNHNSDYYCLNCFHSHRTENKLNVCKKICENHEYCHIEMPSPNNNLIKYNQGEKSLELPFIIYADLECLLKKIDTCYNNPDLSSTTKINQHIPSEYSIYTNCSFDKSNNKLSYYRGEDCMKRFCKDLKDHATKIIDFKKKTMIPLTKEEEDNYNKENTCYICKKDFNNDMKVRDHCHFTGKYRGAAHNTCNLRYKIPKNIPVIFHNGSTYDYHFIIKELALKFNGNFECLGENTEKYRTFSVPIKKKIEENMDITYKIKFIDSFRFMATSLSKLVDNLTDNIHNDKCIKCKSNLCFVRAMNEKLIFKCIDCEKEYEKEFNKELIERFANTYKFCDNDLNKFIMFLRKGVYPYEYIDGWDKFNEKIIPSKELFCSNLALENITKTDYAHANNVFKKFNINNLGEYHDLYVRSDTLLLADIFENFRQSCLKNYELDPAHFVSLPGLAWQVCLIKTNVELELLTDYDMVLMVEEGIRGGICHAMQRFAKANNKYMKDYDRKKKSSYIQYLDTNNLYGKAMTKKLPVRGFRWMDDISKIDEDFVKVYNKNDNKGYILDIDVDYPNKLQNLHSDLPFLPERMVINNTKKLVCNLNDKKNYIVHINVLKQALDHGLKLRKVHRVIEFDQEAWLKEYIDVNTELRKKATNDFEKDFFKLMNNAVFGKTMENVRKHREIKLEKTDKKRNKLVSEPNFHTMKLIDNNLAIIEMRKVKVKMNKPIYLGLSILDISKITMYEFWYDYVKIKYEDKARLCYMDTDSFVVNIKTKDFYKDIAENVMERFDTSNYTFDRPLPTGVNKKVIGLMKDELGGDIYSEFVALRPKAYSYITNDFIEMKKAKGTKKCVVNKMLRFEDY